MLSRTNVNTVGCRFQIRLSTIDESDESEYEMIKYD
jgi:hypothetical protein